MGHAALLHVQHLFLLLQALLLEEEPHVVNGEDDALAVGLVGGGVEEVGEFRLTNVGEPARLAYLLRVDIDAPDQHGVGAVEEGQQHNGDAMCQ